MEAPSPVLTEEIKTDCFETAEELKVFSFKPGDVKDTERASLGLELLPLAVESPPPPPEPCSTSRRPWK